MRRLHEWQKELFGLGMGTWIIHLLLATVIMLTIARALGGFAD
jgi:hypothetical protein